jgi:hypothetical protein
MKTRAFATVPPFSLLSLLSLTPLLSLALLAGCAKGSNGGGDPSAATTAAAPSIVIAASCDAISVMSTCMDYASQSAATADCPSFDGKVSTSPCTSDKLAGSCDIKDKGIRRYYLSGPSPSTKDYAQTHCENSMGGTFIPAPAAAAAGAPGTSAPGAGSAASAASGPVVPEMTKFMGLLDGTSKKVGVALKKFGTAGLKTQDMGDWNLATPQITATTTNGKQTCYTMDAASGATTRTYELCWVAGKIVSVKDDGMK